VTGAAPSNTVTKIQNNTVTSGALTEGHFLVATSTTNWAATGLSGDITESHVTPGSLTVTALDGVALPAPSGAHTVLEYNAGALSWASLPANLPPSGPAFGDLTGNYPSPTVDAIQGNPVSALMLDGYQDGYIMTWTGLLWAAEPANVEATNTVTSSYQINSGIKNDYHIFCDFSAPGSITMPMPVNGIKFEIWDISGSANSNNITLLPFASETIFAPSSLTTSITTNYGHLSVVSNGINWFLSP
jgi:hypothetical protein